MPEREVIRRSLKKSESLITSIYKQGPDDCLPRFERLCSLFNERFSSEPTHLFSSPGRVELSGNHTDHENGHVLAASVNLDIVAAVRPNDSGVIRIQSEYFPGDIVRLDCLAPQHDEVGHSPSLVRGVAARFNELGFNIGGFDAYTTSTVPTGSGLSSSAAYEVLVGTILNTLYNLGVITPENIAEIGKFAENNFFGKPCGLLDQTACSVGGTVYIDFGAQPPHIEKLDSPLSKAGCSLCIVASGASHSDLTDEYAAVTDELRDISSFFGKETLREVSKDDFMSNLPQLRARCGDRAVLRSFHIYSENERVLQQRASLISGDFERFLSLVKDSGHSSYMYLQNVIPAGATKRQEMAVSVRLCEEALGGSGAFRVQGGGFAGFAQAYVPTGMVADFKDKIENILGEGSCRTIDIRPVGSCLLCEIE